MSLTAPLKVTSKSQLEEVKYSLAAAFGDNIHSRNRDIDVQMPDEVCQTKALSRPAGRSTRVGPVTLFWRDSPFAIVHFKVDAEAGKYGYALGGHANWNRRGNEKILKKYFEAVETTLAHLDALPDQYRVSCPCGTEEIVEGTYTAASRFFSHHNTTGEHADSRISTMTLVKRDISAVERPEQTAEQQPSEIAHS